MCRGQAKGGMGLAAESVSCRVTALQGIDAIKQTKQIEKGHPNVLYTHIYLGGRTKLLISHFGIGILTHPLYGARGEYSAARGWTAGHWSRKGAGGEVKNFRCGDFLSPGPWGYPKWSQSLDHPWWPAVPHFRKPSPPGMTCPIEIVYLRPVGTTCFLVWRCWRWFNVQDFSQAM